MNDVFAIGIPTINRADLLNPTLEWYVKDFPNTKIFVVDNGDQEIYQHKNITLFKPGKNLGVAASWNLLCGAIFPQHLCALILNDDVYLGMDEAGVIAVLYKFHVENLYDFIACEKGWCVFSLTRGCYKKVGGFDEEFYPAYYEDNDYRYRLKLKGCLYGTFRVLDPQDHKNSMSLAKDAKLALNIQNNKSYYIKKWGGPPEEETLKIPFGT